VTESAGWYLPHEHICWISERHTTLCRNTRGQLHSIDGPAVAYPDGWEIYALNGVRVPRDLVMTSADQLDVREWCTTKQPNAEIRREAVRKVGIETVIMRLGATVSDKRGDYELLLFDIGDGRKRPHLKMKNPSIGVFHVEGVHPDCKTVEQALNWRNGTTDAPSLLT